jgi:hypothetical protein
MQMHHQEADLFVTQYAMEEGEISFEIDRNCERGITNAFLCELNKYNIDL